MEKTIKVKWHRSGTAYGFGYNAGDICEISKSKFNELVEIGDKGKTKIVTEVTGKEAKPEPTKPEIKEGATEGNKGILGKVKDFANNAIGDKSNLKPATENK